MSGDGLLSLRWNNHRSSFLHILSVLRTKDSYSDVTLACDGHFYAVHKFVLSTCSDYFVEMLEKTSCKHPVIVLKDIQKVDLEALLNYMYLGEVNVLQNDLARLIKAAECLRIKGLAVPDEDPSPAPPPTPGGGGGSGGYSNYSDSRSNKQQRRRRYESEDSEESSSPIRKRPATGDISREKSSPDRRQSRESGAVPSRERESTDSHTRNPPPRVPPIGRDANNFNNEGNVDLSNVKVEAEELKHEEEPKYVEIEDSSDADTNMASGTGETSNSTTQPPRSSSADTSRVKQERSSPGSSSQGGFQPQSIEEIVSQALPGASLVTGDGSGGPWEGGDEGDSYGSFPFSQQQQDSGPGGMHPGSNMGPQHSGDSGRWRHTYDEYQPDWDVSRHSGSSLSLAASHNYEYAQNPSSSISNASMDASVDKLCCCLCGYRADRPSVLEKHMRKHTGEKPFKCPHCTYSSAQSSNLKSHMKYHCKATKIL